MKTDAKTVSAIFADEKFRTARTTINPHQYIVRGKCGLNNADFDNLVIWLRQNGKERCWRGKRYVVWYGPDGFHYWTMGWPVRETTIINRANSEIADQTYEPRGIEAYSSPDGQKPEYA